nr:FecR family protein [Rubrivivax gelatinosus]
MSRPIPAETPPAQILDEAADWLVRLASGDATDADRAACERWRLQSPQHASAWARAERLMSTLGGLPPALAMPALDRRAGRSRRAAIGRLAALIGAVPAGWAAWQWSEGPAGYQLGADHRAATGEQRELLLADGSRVTLNTASAIDVRYDTERRLIQLHAGEILVQSGADPAPRPRPLVVRTAHGTMQALGTRFTVRRFDERTRVAVLDGAVRVEPAASAAGAALLRAGEQADFGRDALGAVFAADETQAAWTRGLLLADRMRLADLADELRRYRGGFVHCDPAVAGLRVSGAYPVGSMAATERALVMLVTTYPVQALKRLRGRWLSFVPR